MRKDRIVSILSILVIGVSMSSIFLMNRPPATAKIPERPPLEIDAARAVSAEDLHDAEAVKRMLLSRISGIEEIGDIEPARIEQLAARSADVMVVRSQGSAEEFLSLIEGWGGRLNIPNEGADYERFRRGWLSPGHAHALGEFGLREAAATRIEPTPGVARVSARRGVSSSSMITNAPVDFAGNRIELLKSGADQVEVHFPVRSNAGDVREVGIRMIWSEPDGAGSRSCSFSS